MFRITRSITLQDTAFPKALPIMAEGEAEDANRASNHSETKESGSPSKQREVDTSSMSLKLQAASVL